MCLALAAATVHAAELCSLRLQQHPTNPLLVRREIRALPPRLPLRHDIALVNPNLHADPAEGGVRVDDRVVDVRAQSMERHPSVALGDRAGHLRAAQPPAEADTDTLRATPHRLGC